MGRRPFPVALGPAKRRLPHLGCLLGRSLRSGTESGDPWREYFREVHEAARADLEAWIASQGLGDSAAAKPGKYETGLDTLMARLVGAAATPPQPPGREGRAGCAGSRIGSCVPRAAQPQASAFRRASLAEASEVDASPGWAIGQEAGVSWGQGSRSEASFEEGGLVGGVASMSEGRDGAEGGVPFGAGPGFGRWEGMSRGPRSIGNWNFEPVSRGRRPSCTGSLRASEWRLPCCRPAPLSVPSA